MKKMFNGCYYLTSISECKNKNDKNILNSQNDTGFIEEDRQSNNLYPGNNSLSIEKFSSKKSSNKLNSKNPLNFLPSISNYNKIKNISFMLSGCISLKSLPDISKRNTSNVTNMEAMFQQCSSLISLPVISK